VGRGSTGQRQKRRHSYPSVGGNLGENSLKRKSLPYAGDKEATGIQRRGDSGRNKVEKTEFVKTYLL